MQRICITRRGWDSNLCWLLKTKNLTDSLIRTILSIRTNAVVETRIEHADWSLIGYRSGFDSCSSGWTPMRPVVVKSPVFLLTQRQTSIEPPSSPPAQQRGPRRWRAWTPNSQSHDAAGYSNYDGRLRLLIVGAMAPTRLLSVPVRGTEHQNLMGEA
jgi:hypothetical protein